jgi:uncharacterized repeat protein (TIGR01451 family)
LPTPSTQAVKFVCDKNQDIWLTPTIFYSNFSSYNFYRWTGSNWLINTIPYTTTGYSDVNDIQVDNSNNFLFSCTNKIIKKANNSLSVFNTPPLLGDTVNIGNPYGFCGFRMANNGDFWCVYLEKPNIQTDNYHHILWHYNGSWQANQIYSDFGSTGIYNVTVDKFNRKWTSSYYAIYQLVGNTWQKIPLPATYPQVTYPYAYFQSDSHGNMYHLLNTQSGGNLAGYLFKYNGNSWTNLNQSGAAVAIDSLDRICIANTFYIYYFNGTTWQTWSTLSAPLIPLTLSGSITQVAARGNVFWFGTNNGDIFTFDGTNFNYITAINNFSAIEAFYVDKANNLWINTDWHKLYRYDGLSFIQYDGSNLPFGSTNPILYAGATDLAGNMWISSNSLAKYNGQNWNFYNIDNSRLLTSGAGFFDIDNLNNIWACNEIGVTVFNESGLPANFTQNISPSFKGTFYYDSNGNGQKETTEYGLSNQKVFILPDSTTRISNGFGQYQFIPNIGNYNLSALLYPNWQQTSNPLNYTVSANPQGADSLDFGIKASVNMDSLELHLWNSGSHCNWLSHYFISYQNKGNTPLSGDIIFTMDSLETFSSAFPNADSLSPFVYSWHFQNLMPFQSQNISVTVQSPNWQAMGQIINDTAQAICPNINVTCSYSDILLCAYDPNDKTSTPLGEHYLHQIKPNCPLEYLIRFQNTGNDVAFNIAVEDTISSYLDMNTFELLGASHFVETKYAQNGAVRFEFPLIMLPDSNQNEALSHGFVAYRIKPKANVPLPAVIENTAFIYFDQNPAVVTNTTRDTMTLFFTGINAPSLQNKLLISPNPFDYQTIVTYSNPYGEGYEVSIYDLRGKLLMRKMDNTGRFSIEKGNLQSGMYLLKVKGRKEMSAKLVVQ